MTRAPGPCRAVREPGPRGRFRCSCVRPACGVAPGGPGARGRYRARGATSRLMKAGPAVGLLHASPTSALTPISSHAIGDTAWRAPAIVGYRMSDVGHRATLRAGRHRVGNAPTIRPGEAMVDDPPLSRRQASTWRASASCHWLKLDPNLSPRALSHHQEKRRRHLRNKSIDVEDYRIAVSDRIRAETPAAVVNHVKIANRIGSTVRNQHCW